MANMGKITKKQVAIRLDLHLCKAVEKKFSRAEDKSDVVAYIRAIEESTRDVLLDDKDYEEIAEQIRRNAAKRKSGNK